jgi:uncharacterized protein YehS (DUF1456 family)
VNNNDILRRLRYTFDFNDAKMVTICALAELSVTKEQVHGWLKKDDDNEFLACSDSELAGFLNGLIIEKRGKKEGALPEAETYLNNNMIFRKLKIAMNLQAEDVLAVMQLADLRMSKHELSAFFRKPGHKHYRKCQDQIMRNFLKGLQLKYRDNPPLEQASATFKKESAPVNKASAPVKKASTPIKKAGSSVKAKSVWTQQKPRS